jgi:hypothetical protein
MITGLTGYVYTSWPHFTDYCLTYIHTHTHTHTEQCRQSRCLITVSNSRRSPASRLTSLQDGDNLTPTSNSDLWLQPILRLLAPRLDWLPTANLQLYLSVLHWHPTRTYGLATAKLTLSDLFTTGNLLPFVLAPSHSSLTTFSLNWTLAVVVCRCLWRENCFVSYEHASPCQLCVLRILKLNSSLCTVYKSYLFCLMLQRQLGCLNGHKLDLHLD